MEAIVSSPACMCGVYTHHIACMGSSEKGCVIYGTMQRHREYTAAAIRYQLYGIPFL